MKFMLGGKGCKPRRDGQHGTAGATRLHHYCQACVEYYGEGDPLRVLGCQGASSPRGSKRRSPSTSQRSSARWARRSVTKRSAARLGALRLTVLDAGMMDTVLNLGLNEQSRPGRYRPDRQRALRMGQLSPLHQMFSKVVLDVEGDLFENAITR